MTNDVTAVLFKLLSVGVLWMSVHCVGMCGPILASFDLGRGKTTWWAQVRGVLGYQLGKSALYALFGAAAGLFGASLNALWAPAGGALATVAGGAMLVYLASRHFSPRHTPAWWPRRQRTVTHVQGASELVQLQRPDRSTPSFGRKVREHLLRLPAEGIGAAMALLPCMIPAWVLALAASTGSPVHGALLMLLLVALNTPILLVARLAGAAAFRIRGVATVLQSVGALWLVLVGLAALDLISHQSVGFHLGEKSFMLMLY